ncbi:hypothetical protein O181_029010 [Austropuccinia psidii MF-1]|uniref:Uncharacterized protein n=1 Tax=Austropuccinia psidii MF-1 TaxID=1389203 RepID=A0A9Q3H4T0_9BASI|nr:hypothetical protein [Austropuccinia psidii MF-1]
MIRTLEDMIRRFCAYGLELKESDGFTHDLCTLIEALELAYKTSMHSSTPQASELLKKAWNPRLPYDILKRNFIDINPTARSFKKIMHIDGCRILSNMKKKYGIKVTKQLILNRGPISSINIKVPNKLEFSFAGPFMIKALHIPNYVQLKLKGELIKKPQPPL